ncbi:TadE/TadG family type IV pilus assembly protein [Roseobacter sp. HKCCD7870]|uniref:TadE/TadG family type IV pilus assembly protein n=1 Tax=Roseobacter sp. HKCCD7870 TaxID=3120343 RepID=UPI0030ECE720
MLAIAVPSIDSEQNGVGAIKFTYPPHRTQTLPKHDTQKGFVICVTLQTLRLATKIAKNFVNSSRNRRIFAALWGHDGKVSAKSAVGQVNGLRMMQGKPKTAQLCRHGLGANRFWRDEQGSVTIFVVLSTMVMVSLGGLAVDVIRFKSQRAQLQSAIDRAVFLRQAPPMMRPKFLASSHNI